MRGGKRLGAGRKPGTGGKPPGTISKAKRELAEMAKEHAEAALDTLVTIHKDAGQPGSARASAANAILDRAYGRPPQALVVPAGTEGSLVITWKASPVA